MFQLAFHRPELDADLARPSRLLFSENRRVGRILAKQQHKHHPLLPYPGTQLCLQGLLQGSLQLQQVRVVLEVGGREPRSWGVRWGVV